MPAATYTQPTERFFNDVKVGDELPTLTKGPMTTLHIMRWSAAMENWHRIHYDAPFAKEVDGLPDVLVNGSWKQQVLCQYIKDWTGRDGWLWKIRFQFRGMDPAGNTIIAAGKVTELAEHKGLGYALIDIYLTNQLDEKTTSGAAVAVLPIRGGKPVPFPFKAPDRCPVAWESY
jgi:acyl dehydratase